MGANLHKIKKTVHAKGKTFQRTYYEGDKKPLVAVQAAVKKVSKKSLGLHPREMVSEADQKKAMAGLSEKERGQLGHGGVLPKEDWPRFRQYMLEKSKLANPKLRPDLTAYTPGETVKLLEHPEIKAWHKEMESFTVPKGYDTVVFVPCAKTKPWEGATKGIYASYNKLKEKHPNLYFVTISEPLGVVPQSKWASFPQYDNPGLFKDPVQRADMFTADWKRLFPEQKLTSRMSTPFDQDAYDSSIKTLSGVVSGFVVHNKKERPDLNYVSFVEDKPFGKTKSVGTHSEMVSQAKAVTDPKRRLLKRASARQQPEDYIEQSLKSLGHIK